MSSQSLMAHTAWTECGNSATPPSLWQNTGATASCRQSSGSPLRCSGASCLHASPSATSGLWSPASRAAWLSRSASAASTRSASRPSVTPSLKPWARSSAACALHCAKKSKNSHSRVDRTIRRSTASFYTPQDLLQLLASSLILAPFIKCCSLPSYPWAHMPSVPFATRRSVTGAAWFCDSSSTPGGLSAPLWERRATCNDLRICLTSFTIETAHSLQHHWTILLICYFRPFLNALYALC